MQFRKPAEQDLEQVVALLAAADLPTADLTPAHLALVADDDGIISGAVGIEHYGEVALLRSLVVAPGARGTGVGRRLVDALEANARGAGVLELWLLTIDADPFFARLGYGVERRDAAPPAIRATEEFSSLCPGNAVLMRKAL